MGLQVPNNKKIVNKIKLGQASPPPSAAKANLSGCRGQLFCGLQLKDCSLFYRFACVPHRARLGCQLSKVGRGKNGGGREL